MLSVSTVGSFGSFGSFGITMSVAASHAQRISAAVLLEQTPALNDKQKAQLIIEQVISLMLPTTTDESQVINLLPQYGVSQKVATLAMNAIPPVETGPTPPGQPPPPPLTPTQRITIATKKITGMSTATKVALGVSVTALVTALILLGAKAKAAA